MFLYIFGALSNLMGFTSCTVISFFAFRASRLGDKKLSFYAFGAFLLSIAFLIYGISLSINALAIIHYQTPFPTHYFFSFWKIAAFLYLGGYSLIGGSYTIHNVKRSVKLALVTFPFLLSMVTIEATNILLSLYLLLLISYTTIKTKSKKIFLVISGYLLIFLAQVLITWGRYSMLDTFFLLGVALRGIGFFPLLIVALGSEAR